jgi:diguanylate cyclase (GGDEF)-like protein
MMRFAQVWSRWSVAAKLYCVTAISFMAVAGLAAASIHFAVITATAARHLYEDGFIGVERSSRLAALLEQQRRIVESAPAEVDRARLTASRRMLDEVNGKIKKLATNLGDADDITYTPIEAFSEEISKLVALGHQVLFYAYNFAQDKATESAVDYAHLADMAQEKILAYRDERLRIADSEVSHLSESALTLIRWVLICALVAVICLGPLGLMITRRVLTRLAQITGAMSRLAQNDTTVQVRSRNDHDEVGNMARAVEIFKTNAIELLQRKMQLEEMHRKILALNNMSHGLCMFDASQRLVVCNERYVQMYQLTPALAKPGTQFHDILKHRISIGNYTTHNTEELTAVSAATAARDETTTFSQDLTDGRIIAIAHQPMAEGGWVAVHEDITERRRTEARIAYMAHHDALTDLPNRIRFREDMEKALGRVDRGESIAVLCLDLDHFKPVNDTMGHPIGDALLLAVSDRLRACVRPNDTVARLGGDEFAIVQVAADQPVGSTTLAERLIKEISEPYEIRGHQIVIGASVGIAVAPSDGRDPDQLLKNADMALYRAKEDGRGTHRFFEPEMDEKMQVRRALELDLRKAFALKEFEVFYQPLINVKSNMVSGFEALLRWRHPQRGMVSPAEFIPLAEEIGLIGQIGAWVLKQACIEAASWPGNIKIAVNLSPSQFKSRTVVLDVISALGASGLAPRRLELEITETVLMEDTEATVLLLGELRDLGVRISMDDFGTGYSSLGYLRKFPFDKIKIDRSFIHDLSKKPESIAIVRAIAGLGSSLGIATTAEGVETEEELRQLKCEGCTEVQGYLFSEARPAKELGALLQRLDTVQKAVA